jgi:CHRD domain
MAMHPEPTVGYEVTRRRRMLAAATALLLIGSASACTQEAPTEMTVELPLVAAYSAHTGTPGRSFALDMSQELSTTVTGDPDGVGTALLTLNAGQQTVCWSTTASGIALPATASHIHHAPAGLSGPIVLPLSPPGANGQASGCAQNVDRDLIVDIFTNPGAYYVNVHTSEFPPGAIRSQMDQ